MKIPLGLIALAILAVVGLWASTPSAGDLKVRVDAYAAARHAGLLKPGELPAQLVDAAVATEDERFFSHHGVDLVGIARALGDDAARGCLCEGGSTITQQLVKIVYLGGDDRGLHKFQDAVLALKAETVLSKREILADYLSIIPTGYGLYGVSAAACAYFGRPLQDLDLAQYALIAGMTQAPALYDPRTHPNAARTRRHQVLESMVSAGYLTPARARAAEAEPVTARGPGCS